MGGIAKPNRNASGQRLYRVELQQAVVYVLAKSKEEAIDLFADQLAAFASVCEAKEENEKRIRGLAV